MGDDSAMITKVEYKDAEGNYQTVPYVEGVYILPEGTCKGTILVPLNKIKRVQLNTALMIKKKNS
ncbi:hypothetical protein INT80_12460 [Gallibacterium anatis]|uniref:Uncharacterized protein n=1 Tax=Gallibacterium anatis TaxID=750 RepID=A0A930UTD9_9PAST|nr:hypothetical protein [Gallibacterium anatis]